MRPATRSVLGLSALVAGSAGVCLAAAPPEPIVIVGRLAATGSRTPGSAGHHAAQELLLTSMMEAGLEQVARLPVSGTEAWQHLQGVLSGTGDTNVVLTAHYDSVAGSPGVYDNATGCAVALTAAADLTRTPRRHGVRLLLTDGEENLAAGSREWLTTISDADRQRILASLDLDMLGAANEEVGVVHILSGKGRGGRALTPAWLVHAILRAAEVAGFDLAILDRRWSWWAQLAVRCSRPGRVSDGRRFLEAGIPAVTLSDLAITDRRTAGPGGEDCQTTVDGARLSEWARLIAGATRRMDGFVDRPLSETEYLVLWGRVWIRRDLVWAGFALWILLVWRGLPGRWRQRSSSERRRAGRAYLPGFAFRMLYLLSVFLIPAFATLLLSPAAVLALARRARTETRRRLVCLLAAVPALGFALWLTVGQLVGWLVLDGAAVLPAGLVGLTLATFWVWQSEPEPQPSDRVD